MTSTTQAVQDAFFAAMNVPALTSLAPVVQHILEETQPPLIAIGNIDTEDLAGKGGGLDKVTVEIWTYSSQPNREEIYALQAAVRSVLDRKHVLATGYTLSDPTEISSSSLMLSDGSTYVGTQTYELFAQ